jgi:hypothetical protein
MGCGPPKGMKNGLGPATALLGSVTLPFVISTEAQRSGEISVLMLRLGNVFRQSVPGFPATQQLNRAACAPFREEGRMKYANANKFHRKSGGA